MTTQITIHQAIQNGVRSLTRDSVNGHRLRSGLARINQRDSEFRGNKRAATYWQIVALTCEQEERRRT